MDADSYGDAVGSSGIKLPGFGLRTMSGSGFDGTGANGRPASFLSTASTSVPGIKSDFTYRILALCSDFPILIPLSDESPSDDRGLRPPLVGIQEQNPWIAFMEGR
jgi:hypothetical protein